VDAGGKVVHAVTGLVVMSERGYFVLEAGSLVLRFFRRDEDFGGAALNLGEFDEPALAEVDAAPYGVGDQTEPVPRRTRPVAAQGTCQLRRVRCRHQPPRITVREICCRLDADLGQNARRTPRRIKRESINNTLDRSGESWTVDSRQSCSAPTCFRYIASMTISAGEQSRMIASNRPNSFGRKGGKHGTRIAPSCMIHKAPQRIRGLDSPPV
jgi:hypothetical protein